MLANIPFYAIDFTPDFFYTSVLASPDLSGNLLSYTLELPTANVQPDAATLTLHALDWLKRLNTSKTNRIFPNFLF